MSLPSYNPYSAHSTADVLRNFVEGLAGFFGVSIEGTDRPPPWAVQLLKEMEKLVGLTEDIQADVADLQTVMADITTYANDSQARLATLQQQIADLQAEVAAGGNVDPAVVQQLSATVDQLQAQAAQLVTVTGPAPIDTTGLPADTGEQTTTGDGTTPPAETPPADATPPADTPPADTGTADATAPPS